MGNKAVTGVGFPPSPVKNKKNITGGNITSVIFLYCHPVYARLYAEVIISVT